MLFVLLDKLLLCVCALFIAVGCSSKEHGARSQETQYHHLLDI